MRIWSQSRINAGLRLDIKWAATTDDNLVFYLSSLVYLV